jgi:hypothetical protein
MTKGFWTFSVKRPTYGSYLAQGHGSWIMGTMSGRGCVGLFPTETPQPARCSRCGPGSASELQYKSSLTDCYKLSTCLPRCDVGIFSASKRSPVEADEENVHFQQLYYIAIFYRNIRPRPGEPEQARFWPCVVCYLASALADHVDESEALRKIDVMTKGKVTRNSFLWAKLSLQVFSRNQHKAPQACTCMKSWQHGLHRIPSDFRAGDRRP